VTMMQHVFANMFLKKRNILLIQIVLHTMLKKENTAACEVSNYYLSSTKYCSVIVVLLSNIKVYS
jgi:hypothetical protein